MSDNIPSILTSTKKSLGLEEDYTAFDADLVMHINSALGTLNDLGLGPVSGFTIEDKSSTWAQFMGTDPRLNPAKSYVYMRVKLLFDPPPVGYVLTAFERQIKEAEWRLAARVEDIIKEIPVLVIDGGTP